MDKLPTPVFIGFPGYYFQLNYLKGYKIPGSMKYKKYLKTNLVRIYDFHP